MEDIGSDKYSTVYYIVGENFLQNTCSPKIDMSKIILSYTLQISLELSSGPK